MGGIALAGLLCAATTACAVFGGDAAPAGAGPGAPPDQAGAPADPAAGLAAEPRAEGLPKSHRADADLIETQGRLGREVLRARAFELSLGESSRLAVPEGPSTLGDTVAVRIEIFNRLGRPFELFETAQGLTLELDFEIDRWLPQGDHDRVYARRVVRLTESVALEPGAAYDEYVEIPLLEHGDPASLWKVSLSARLRFDGARFGERQIPAHQAILQPGSFLAFPEGWEAYRTDPLDGLRRAAALPNASVDRHLLVCAALLPPAQRSAGIEDLIAALETAPNERRARTIGAALAWLTGAEPSVSASAWRTWLEQGSAAPR